MNGFPGSSVGKEELAGDPSSIPGLGRSAREGIGYPLQYSWASLVSQLVKKLWCHNNQTEESCQRPDTLQILKYLSSGLLTQEKFIHS